ncbi:MAG: hypothetical protein IKK08_01630 [Clostridia bacterium]|nr:hypothetical protein [Clostridia bacterium]
MKLAFSTLGCPDFSWSDMYSMARDFGFDGIEMRGLGNDFFSVRAQSFRPDQLDKTIAKRKRMHLEIPCLSTGCVLKDAYKWNETREEIKEYIRLAEKLGTPYIRLLGDRNAAGKIQKYKMREWAVEYLKLHEANAIVTA